MLHSHSYLDEKYETIVIILSSIHVLGFAAYKRKITQDLLTILSEVTKSLPVIHLLFKMFYLKWKPSVKAAKVL